MARHWRGHGVMIKEPLWRTGIAHDGERCHQRQASCIGEDPQLANETTSKRERDTRVFGLLRASSVRTMHHGAFRSAPAGRVASGARHASAAVPTLEPAWTLTALLVVVDSLATAVHEAAGAGSREDSSLWEPGRRQRTSTLDLS